MRRTSREGSDSREIAMGRVFGAEYAQIKGKTQISKSAWCIYLSICSTTSLTTLFYTSRAYISGFICEEASGGLFVYPVDTVKAISSRQLSLNPSQFLE